MYSRAERPFGSDPLLQSRAMPPEPTHPQIRDAGDAIEVVAAVYSWGWSPSTDEFVLADPDGRAILRSPLQPAVEATGRPSPGPGRCVEHSIDGSRLRVRYEGVNHVDGLRITLRFESTHLILEQATYKPADDTAVVRIAWFARWSDSTMAPTGAAGVCVIPGGRQDPEQAIFPTADLEDHRFSVGAFGLDVGTYHQQWALPHYLVAAYNDGDAESGAACIGLGAPPAGSVLVRVHRGRFSYEINVRGDLWGNCRGPTPVRFDEPIVVAVAPDWYQAGLAYFDALHDEGYAPRRKPDDVPAAAFLPQYDTWGDQGARRCFLQRFNEQHLREIYADFRASDLRSRLFVIDDKWEGQYGSLVHDPERFPHFTELLDEIRANGHEIGIWTAFPRCEDYEALGLTADAVLRTPDGTPFVQTQRNRSWYIFDPTNAAAAAHLADRARHLIGTYRPAMVKIDFGYEIPTPDVAAPHDLAYAGERLFQRFLEMVVGAMKEADPRVTVLYYCLTPLFARYMDLSGADDLWMSRGAYDAGFARRALLSSWCGAFGVVPYASSGYDWRSMREIWLDTAVIGTPGVIAPLAGDEYGDKLTPQLVAIYNGLTRITRQNPLYRARVFDGDLSDPTLGPRARTWARIEHGAAVVVTLRPGADGVARAPGVAQSDCPIVVASLTADGIGTSSSLGIVPFEAGSVAIEREDERRANARARLLSGRVAQFKSIRVEPGRVVVDVAPQVNGEPVELIEIQFA